MAATNGVAAANGLPEDPIILRARLAEVEARYAESQVQFRELRTWYDKLKRQHRELCLLYTSPSPRDQRGARMPSSA